MAAVESKHEQIIQAIATRLRGIVGDAGVSYWYTPDVVIIPADFEPEVLNSTYQTIYALIADYEDKRPVTFTETESDAYMDLVVLRQFERVASSPFVSDPPTPATVQNRLLKDAEKRLRGDRTLGGLAVDMSISRADRAAEKTAVGGWAVGMLRLAVNYTYSDEAP